MDVPFFDCPNIKISLEPEPRIPAGGIIGLAVSSTAYVAPIFGILKSFQQTQTGTILLDSIKHIKKKTMRILPYSVTEEKANGINAYASPSSWEDATPKGRRPLYCGGPNTGKPITQFKLGTRAGSDVVVNFSSKIWR